MSAPRSLPASFAMTCAMLVTSAGFAEPNGKRSEGGSLDGAGPVVAGGMVFVNSGYPRFGGTPGNVLLAFGLR